MSVNFAVAACREPQRNDSLFGICDDQDGTKAYTNTNDPQRWIAKVKNDRNKELIFTAVDKCILQDHDYPGRGRCDGLLTSDEHLYFIELKVQKKHWITGTIEQLESTIQLFIEGNDITIFRHKKAFACNKRHTYFQEIDNELNLSFFRKYGVRIDVQADIIVV